MAISLVALRYFKTVATIGNVSRAADLLNVAQSAVSRQILSLEEELGATLLLRHRRGVDLTAAGRHVLARADDILRQASDLRREVGALDPTPRGALRIGFPASLGDMIVAPLVAAIATDHPAISVALFEGFSFDVAERIEDDRLDIGITSWLDPNPELQLTALFSEEIWLVGLDRDWRFGERVGPAEIADAPLIVTNAIRRRVAQWAGVADGMFGRAIETDSQAMLLPLLHRGMGHLVVPRSAVHADLANGRLRGAPLDGLRLTRYLAQRKDRVRSAATGLFVGLLEARLAHLDAQGGLLRRVPS